MIADGSAAMADMRTKGRATAGKVLRLQPRGLQGL